QQRSVDSNFSTNADSGAGGTFAGNAAAAAATAAAAALAALGSPQMDLQSMSSMVECQGLRKRMDQQEAALKSAKHRELQLQHEVEDPDWMMRRMGDLERDSDAWHTERSSVEERVSQLVGIVSAAPKDEPQRASVADSQEELCDHDNGSW
ncbi:unnamed protein product, partial [Polarella glacialis]